MAKDPRSEYALVPNIPRDRDPQAAPAPGMPGSLGALPDFAKGDRGWADLPPRVAVPGGTPYKDLREDKTP